MRRVVYSVLAVVVGLVVGCGLWYRSYLVSPSPGQGDVVVVIPKGAGVRGTGMLLAAQGLVQYDLRYLVMVRLSGLQAQLKAGEYRIARGLTPPEILQLLAKGSNLRHQVTIPEGLTARQIADIFAQEGWARTDQFLALVQDPVFIHQLGIQATSLEGYLFPETYILIRDETNAETIIRMMVDQFEHVWKGLQVPADNPLSTHQLLTLASMVEKETGAAPERPLIARVFYNRLAKKMRLQSDPTVIYGLPAFNGNLTKADLLKESPYNTYLIPALPPGPICNPGRAALEAVLHPTDSEALYFVAKNDGTHVFSNNLTDHNRAVRTYQLNQ